MDIKKGTHIWKSMKISVEELNSTWLYPILLSELTFGDFAECVITMRHIKTEEITKYL